MMNLVRPPLVCPANRGFALNSRIPGRIRATLTPAQEIDLTALETAIQSKNAEAIRSALDQLNEAGWAKKWRSQPYVSRRPTSLRELTAIGIKNAETLAIPSVRNDAAFLFTVVGTTSFLAVLAGQLPGDWGFFVPYLIGSFSLIVLAVGSISPGIQLHRACSI